MAVKTYNCPACGGKLIYSAGTDQLICPQCSATYDVKDWEIKELRGETVGLKSEEGQDNAGTGLKAFKCPACGADLVTDEHSAAMSCAFCGSPALIESRLSGEFAPRWVLPFKFDKKQAQEYFKKWRGRGLLTPGTFKSSAVMDKVTGVYVPFWLYSYTAETDLYADATRKLTEGNTEKTEIYKVTLDAQSEYKLVPVNASEKMPDDAMRVMEPFDYSELRDFAMQYLTGFTAEKYNQPASAFEEKVQAELKEDAIGAAKEQITGFDTVEVTDSAVRFTNGEEDYAMLPVWSLNFMYAGKSYPLFMNGQTGKIYGRLPISAGRAFVFFLIAFAVFFLIAFLLGGVL